MCGSPYVFVVSRRLLSPRHRLIGQCIRSEVPARPFVLLPQHGRKKQFIRDLLLPLSSRICSSY
jgi:hypothetical protein